MLKRWQICKHATPSLKGERDPEPFRSWDFRLSLPSRGALAAARGSATGRWLSLTCLMVTTGPCIPGQPDDKLFEPAKIRLHSLIGSIQRLSTLLVLELSNHACFTCPWEIRVEKHYLTL